MDFEYEVVGWELWVGGTWGWKNGAAWLGNRGVSGVGRIGDLCRVVKVLVGWAA